MDEPRCFLSFLECIYIINYLTTCMIFFFFWFGAFMQTMVEHWSAEISQPFI